MTLGTVALERDEIVVDPFRVQAPGVAIAGSLRGGAAQSALVARPLRAGVARDLARRDLPLAARSSTSTAMPTTT